MTGDKVLWNICAVFQQAHLRLRKQPRKQHVERIHGKAERNSALRRVGARFGTVLLPRPLIGALPVAARPLGTLLKRLLIPAMRPLAFGTGTIRARPVEALRCTALSFRPRSLMPRAVCPRAFRSWSVASRSV